MLQAQRVYGDVPRTATLRRASFGAVLRQQLPEDVFDRQPLIQSNRFMLVADVRLDNRQELLSALGIRGADLADSAILFEAWLRWQESCLDRLVGDFAFALWDSDEQRLTLARDATGQRPLLYWHDGGRIAFASVPNGLLACPFVRTGFSFETLARESLDIPNTSEATYFDRISRVRPGHFAVFDRGSVRQVNYWHAPTDFLELSEDEFVDSYQEQVERAVGAALRRNSGSVGVHLSSGLDSSLVTATAARLSPDSKPIAFTSAPRLGFNGPVQKDRIADESELAACTARMYGLEHMVVRPEGRVLQQLRDHNRLFQEPSRNVPNMQWWSAIHRCAREKGVSTVLTGEMGNLSINAGELIILADWVHRGQWLEWWRQAKGVAKLGKARWRGILINSFESWLGARLVRHLERHFMGAPSERDHSYLHEHWLRELRGASLHSSRDFMQGSFNERRLKVIRSEDIAIHRKGALAESGMDERDPLANRNLIEFSLRLPPEQMLQRGEWRPLAKRALAGRLPEAVLHARQRGYQAADWFERISKEEARAIIEEISTSSAVNRLFDLQRVRRDIERWPSRGAADFNSRMIYRTGLIWVLSAGVFLQEFESPAS
jgi:asparagine synthase (glutamine-hydrolysing)